MSKKIFTYNEVSLGAHDTIPSKLNMEQEALYEVVQVNCYWSNNGVYTSANFMKELATKVQGINMIDIGSHHHNGGEEASIKTVV